MSVPDQIREELKTRLWREADTIGWSYLPRPAKSRYYDNWAKDPAIGGVIERYVDRRQIRHYLKDTILKRYSAARKADADRPLRVLGIPADAVVVEEYEKPHGRRLEDGTVVAWGRAREWKALLTGLHERAFAAPEFRPHGVVLFQATGRFADARVRNMVEDAATKLGVPRVIWLEM